MSKETIAALKEECSMVDTIALLRYIRLLSELSNQIRTATQKRVLLEVGFIKLCRPEMESDTEKSFERIRQLEDKIAQGIPMIPANGPGNAGMITSKGTFAYDPYTGQPLALPAQQVQEQQVWLMELKQCRIWCISAGNRRTDFTGKKH